MRLVHIVQAAQVPSFWDAKQGTEQARLEEEQESAVKFQIPHCDCLNAIDFACVKHDKQAYIPGYIVYSKAFSGDKRWGSAATKSKLRHWSALVQGKHSDHADHCFSHTRENNKCAAQTYPHPEASPRTLTLTAPSFSIVSVL